MPKLLSRSKHEEFELNLALQIKDQKERRAENTKKMEPAKFASCEHRSCLQPATVPPAATVHLFFDALMFLLQFFVSSHFIPCNSFRCLFFFFFLFPLL